MSKKGKTLLCLCLFVYFIVSLGLVNYFFHDPDIAVWATLFNIVLCTIVMVLFFLPDFLERIFSLTCVRSSVPARPPRHFTL